MRSGQLARAGKSHLTTVCTTCILMYTHMIERRITRYGNSLGVRLPAALARDLELHAGDRVALRRVKNGLIMERSARSRLAERLATVRHPEIEIGAGKALGVEQL